MYESCGSAPFAPSSPALKSSFLVFGSPAFAFALLTSSSPLAARKDKQQHHLPLLLSSPA
jgi:hypothetical protein